MQALHLTIRGRVQGVGFRYFTLDLAERMGVSGWVRNAHDGSVEAFAQGAASQLDAFVEAVRAGPPMGHVDSIDIQPGTPKPSESGFRIRR